MGHANINKQFKRLIMSQLQVVTVSPNVMSGTPVFRGTRVPVQNLVDYLKAGDSMVSD